MRVTKITIIQNREPREPNLNDLLQWFGESLGLFSSRDKDKSCYRIFILLIKALKLKVGLTSDEIAMQTNLTRGTVIHHLNTLMDMGVVVNVRNKYSLNFDTLEELTEKVRVEVNKTFDNLKNIGSKIDIMLGIYDKKDEI